jgi:hypothetical protein
MVAAIGALPHFMAGLPGRKKIAVSNKITKGFFS